MSDYNYDDWKREQRYGGGQFNLTDEIITVNGENYYVDVHVDYLYDKNNDSVEIQDIDYTVHDQDSDIVDIDISNEELIKQLNLIDKAVDDYQGF